MALDWSKASRRRQSSDIGNDAALMRMASEPRDPQPSKAELRALGVALLADYARPIRVLPSIIELKCGCGHRGRVKVYRGERKRFRCSKCGYLSL